VANTGTSLAQDIFFEDVEDRHSTLPLRTLLWGTIFPNAESDGAGSSPAFNVVRFA